MLAANCGTLSFLCPLSSSWSRTLYHPLHCSHHWLVATAHNTGDKDRRVVTCQNSLVAQRLSSVEDLFKLIIEVRGTVLLDDFINLAR